MCGFLAKVVQSCVWFNIQKHQKGTSFVVKWLRTCLLMQGTWVQSLPCEDPTCWGATEPVDPKGEAHEPYSLCCTVRKATATRTQNSTRKSNNSGKPHAATRPSTVRKKSPHWWFQMPLRKREILRMFKAPAAGTHWEHPPQLPIRRVHAVC